MVAGNIHQKICKVRPCGFRDMSADMQRDRQTKTDMIIAILRTSPGGEIISMLPPTVGELSDDSIMVRLSVPGP